MVLSTLSNKWPSVYAALAALSFAAGAGAFGLDHAGAGVGWASVAVSFLGGLVYPAVAMARARSGATRPFPRPSLLRGCRGSWIADPLQYLRISILLIGAFVLGALLLALPQIGSHGAMLVLRQAVVLPGLLAGERAAYLLFRGSIG